MASRGRTRTGETYCLSCFQQMESPEIKQCPGCMSNLEEDVRAFLCPKCHQVMVLGEPQCPKCGLKFKVKALKPKEPKEDDKLLIKLIEWGKPSESATAAKGDRRTGPDEQPPESAPVASAERLKRLSELKESIKDLMDNRSAMLDRMQRRMEAEKARLSEIGEMDVKGDSSNQVEAEIMALADEMADITMLQAHMESLSDEISSLMGSMDVSAVTKERGLAAKALRMKLDAKEKELAELKSREEQLARKEEMVDHKIQAYAQKKKQLDKDEGDLRLRLSKLEEEREELGRLRGAAADANTESARDDVRNAWLEEQKNLKRRVLGLKSSVTTHRTGTGLTEEEIDAAEGNLGSMIADLESQIGGLIAEKAELQMSISEATAVDQDLRKLLIILDQLLGQLPEESIEMFSKSDDFKLYERMLDRLKI